MRDNVPCTKAAFLCNKGAHLVLSQQDGCLFLSGLARLLPLPSFCRGTFPCSLRRRTLSQGMGGSAAAPALHLAPVSVEHPPRAHTARPCPRRAGGCPGWGGDCPAAGAGWGAAEDVWGGRCLPCPTRGSRLLQGRRGEGRPCALAGKHPVRASSATSLLLNRLFTLFPSRDIERRGIVIHC